MTRSGPPDDPNDPNYYSDNEYSDSEPTVYANYGTGGYEQAEYPGEPEPETPWYRKPPALVGFGAVAALLVAAIIYVAINMGDDDSAPTDATTSSETSTSAAVLPAPTGTVTVTQSPTDTETTAPPTTTTTTESTTTTTTTPTTTTTTTTVPPTTSTSTVTETKTETETVTPPAPEPEQP
jgi:cytoskeletal protein RodZ